MGLILQQLPDNDKPLIFMGVDDIRDAKAGPTQYSFRAEFLENVHNGTLPSKRKTYYAWVNMRFFPMFLPASEWRSKQKERENPIKGSRVRDLSGADFCLIADIRGAFRADNQDRAVVCHGLGLTTDLHPGRHFRYGPHLLTRNARSYMIATSEIVRFYVGAFGAIFYELMSSCSATPAFDPPAILDNLVDLDQSGWVNDRTFKIAPKAGMVDRLSAAQLALLMTDHELLRAIWFIARSLALQTRFDADRALVAVLPQDRTGGFELQLGDPIDTVLNVPGIKQIMPVKRIRKDRRPFAFSRLIIEVAGAQPASAFSVVRPQSGGVREEPLFGDDVAITENQLNNGTVRRMSAFGPTFSDCFPAVSDITLTLSYRDTKGTARRRQVKTVQKTPSDTATLNSTKDKAEGITRFERADRSYISEPEAENTEKESKALFPVELPAGDVSIEYLPRQVLGARLQTFSKTRAVLFQDGILQPLFDSEGSDVEPLIVPPKSWGPFAHSRKFGPRYIGVMCIPTEVGRTFYAIELGQLAHGEYVSMGVAGRRDGRALSTEELYGLLYKTCRLGDISTTNAKTIWPMGYCDIDVAPIVHHSRLYLPMELRMAILTTISGLVARGERRSTVN